VGDVNTLKIQLVTRAVVSSGALATVIAVVGAGRKWLA
jgi:hypothetical protein